MILRKFPVFSLFNRDFGGDGFAADCLHRQRTFSRTENVLFSPHDGGISKRYGHIGRTIGNCFSGGVRRGNLLERGRGVP